jgi:transcriptional regulator with GAF, ATPase, and Fis domain
MAAYDCTVPMTLSLIAIDGALKGTVFPLRDGQISIGRDNSNDLVVDDAATSRCHCTLEFVPEKPSGGRYKLVDMESRNGTFVNGVPVRERWLEQGDQIKVGLSVFLFSALSGEAAERPNEQLAAGPITRSTSQLRREDAIYLHPEKLDRSFLELERAGRDVKALLRISKEIHQAESRADFYRRVLELILQTIPAGTAAVFLRAEEPGESEFTFGLHRDGSESEPFIIERSIARQVIGEAMAIIADSTNATSGPSTAVTVLAAPLVCFDNIAGLLYLTATRPHGRFDEADLQLLTAVGSIAGLALGNILRLENLQAENVRLTVETQLQHEMIGESAAMRQVYDFIAKAAPSDVSVLIDGENGTGKELAARAIHRNSRRADKPFIAVNCAALTESLLETELFGHEKGAFTGAIAQKKGKFELAHSGTIFLDEIGELAPSIQSKLLRVLQERELDRVGGTKPIKIDVRLIAATNRNLQVALKDGTFRQDLFFRLNVVSITMPSLRQRRDDIPLLASYFAAKASARARRRIQGISEKARSWLMQYDWPGNVRELENAIERAVVMGSSDVIMPEDLPESILEIQPVDPLAIDKYHEALNQAKREVVLRALEQAHGVQSEAAKLLEIHPVYLNRLIRKMDLKKLGHSTR